MACDKPHAIEDEHGDLVPASTAEVASVVFAHAAHDGIAYFGPECAECVAALAAGKYPHWT